MSDNELFENQDEEENYLNKDDDLEEDGKTFLRSFEMQTSISLNLNFEFQFSNQK